MGLTRHHPAMNRASITNKASASPIISALLLSSPSVRSVSLRGRIIVHHFCSRPLLPAYAAFSPSEPAPRVSNWLWCSPSVKSAALPAVAIKAVPRGHQVSIHRASCSGASGEGWPLMAVTNKASAVGLHSCTYMPDPPASP